MRTLHLEDNLTHICIDDVSTGCFFYEDGFFYQEALAIDRYRVSYASITSFDAYYFNGKFVDFEDFYFLLDKVSFSQEYQRTCRLYRDAWASDVEFYNPVCSVALCSSSRPLASSFVMTDLSVDRACLVDPIEVLPPIELVVEDGTMVLHKGRWHEECWYSEECLYYWAYDKDGYECAFQVSIHDIDMVYINGWHFTQEQTVEYFDQYRVTLENELAVAPLIINHYHLNEMVLDYVPARRYKCTESVAELSLGKDGELLYRHPYSSVKLHCAVKGRTVSLTDGTLAILTPGATLITMVCRDFSAWLITLSHILNGHYGW